MARHSVVLLALAVLAGCSPAPDDSVALRKAKNDTNAAVDSARSAATNAADAARAAAADATVDAREAADRARAKAGQAMDVATAAAGEAVDSTKDALNGPEPRTDIDRASQAASEVGARTKELAVRANDQVRDAVARVAQRSRELSEQAKGRGDNTVNN